MIKSSLRQKNISQAVARGATCIVLLAMLHGCGLFLSEQAQLKRAETAEQHGDYRTASIDLKSLLQKHPQNLEARLHLGTVMLALGDGRAAIQELEKIKNESAVADKVTEPLVRAYLGANKSDAALQLLDAQKSATASPQQNATRLRLRGEALSQLHRFADAQTTYNQALAIAPNDVPSILGLASVVAEMQGPKAALAITDRALAVQPNDAETHRLRGSLLLVADQAADALTEFKQAVADVTDKRRATWLLSMAGVAQAQLTLKQVPDALTTTAQMQKVAANSPLTRYMRAYALVQNGQLDQARPLLEQNVASVSDPRSRVLLGAVNLGQGRLGQAEMYLSSAVAADPTNTQARQLLAETRLRQAKPVDALDAIAPVLNAPGADSRSDAADTNANLLALAGRASLAAGQSQKGVEYLQRNSTLHPESIKAKLDLAAGYLAAGQADRALEILNSNATTSGETSSGAGVNPSTADTASEQARREYLSVLARLKKGDAAGGEAYAEQLVRTHPNEAFLQALAGSVFALHGKYEQAHPYLEAVVRLKPDSASGYLALGRLELTHGHTEQAKQQFSLALKKQPANVTAAIALALMETGAGHADAAQKLLQEAARLNPTSVDVRVLQVQLYLQRGALDDAEKTARSAVALAGDNPSALAALGRVLSVQGKHEESIRTFTRAVHVAPKNAVIRYQLAVAERVAGHADQSLSNAQAALEIDPHYFPAAQLAVAASLAQHQIPEAAKYLDALVKIAPEQSSTQALLGEVRAAQQRYQDAAAAFHKAMQLQATYSYAIREFQVRKLGKLAEPLAPLKEYLTTHPRDQAVLVVLAQEYQEQGERKLAMQSYEQALAVNAKNPVALNNLAWMHYEDGLPDALELSRRAYEAAPRSVDIVDTRAWLLANANQAAEAVTLLEKIPGMSHATSADSQVPAEIVAHYAVALERAGRAAQAQTLAREIASKQLQQMTPPMQKLVTELAKS